MIKTREHIYYDSKTKVIAKKTIEEKEDGSKSVLWYRFENGEWILKLNGLKPPLYNIPELIASTGTIYIVEGEKDVETLQRMNLTATTSPYGSNGNSWDAKSYNKYFKDRDVVILADNDKVGKAYAEDIAKTVAPVAKSIKLIPSENIWPKLKEKGDISDIVEELGIEYTKELLEKAVARTDFCPYGKIQIEGEIPYYIEKTPNGKTYINPYLLSKSFKESTIIKLVQDSFADRPDLYIYENGVYSRVTDGTVKHKITNHIKSYNENLIKIQDVKAAFEFICNDEVDFNPNEFNTDENIVNLKNGILKLDTMQLLPHSPEYLTTIQIPVDWDEDSIPTPKFDEFLDTLSNGDKNIQRLLMQYLGVAISNISGSRFKKALFLVGEGDTGKSQFRKLADMLVGKNNCCSTDIGTMESRFGLANLYGKRIAGNADMSFMKAAEIKIFKQLTGGDMVDIERKHKDTFSGTFNGVLWFGANRMPLFGGDPGEWVYQRMIIVKCTNVILKEKQNSHICDEMFEERDGIVQKAILALKKVIENGYKFDIPESCLDNLEEYKAMNSVAVAFFKECCVMRAVPINVKASDKCTSKAIKDVFKAWSLDNYNYVPTMKDFERDIASFLHKKEDELKYRNNANRYYIFTLIPEIKSEYNKQYGFDSVC